jgi:hypothetical protein
MEGAVVDQVRHVAEGHRLYVAPSIHFIPFQYPPLFFYLGALVTRIAGGGFPAAQAHLGPRVHRILRHHVRDGAA